MTAVLTARRCAELGWPVFPWGRHAPLTEHGQNDATTDATIIREWWCRWPNATPAIRTGRETGVVALDIDVGHADGANGLDSLDDLGLPFHPQTPTCSTPRGGLHVLFAPPGGEVLTRTIAPGLEIKGERGSIILAPGPGRAWDPHLGIDTPLALMPEQLIPGAPERPTTAGTRPVVPQPLGRYAEAALDRAVANILDAPAGQQRDTLNRESYGIGQLVAGGIMPSAVALDALLWAGPQLISHDHRRPWRETEKMIRAAFLDGLRDPRRPVGRRYG
jgi:Bifunctional DNA primase/polymerase, N-terminal